MNTAPSVVADIGGTNARFACVDPDDGSLFAVRRYICTDFPTIGDAVRDYLSSAGLTRPHSICLAVPGVVERDQVSLPNSHWTFSQAALRKSLDLDLVFINDFTAQLYSTFTLSAEELTWLGDARPAGGQIRAAIGPGTGLGVKALTPNGDLIPSEGGHFAWAPTDPHELDLLRLLWRRHGRVSVERVVSGPGLSALYWANSILAGQEAELGPEQVSAGAQAGDETCLRSVTDFIRVMGATAGDLALILGPLDGVYLMGDLLHRLAPFYDAAMLRARFNDKGRYTDYCASMPLALARAEMTGLRGCAEVLKHRAIALTGQG